jgi:hypothetical protein
MQGNPSPRRYRALNVLEELDQPGEFVIDRGVGRLYLWPPADLKGAQITLATLEAAGLVGRTAVLGGPARYDANVGPHHHFVCTRCGCVQDFVSPALDSLPLPPSLSALGRVESTQVQVRGVCAACARRRRGCARRRNA